MDSQERFYSTFPMFHRGFCASTVPAYQRKHYIDQTDVIEYKRRYDRNDSSYRRSRSAANLRERRRMQCINEAFEGLRSHIPTLPYEKRLSKVDTLRLSICYINFLTELVSTDPEGKDNTGVFSNRYREPRKIVIYNASNDDKDQHDLPPVRGHSLSWSSENGKTKLNFVKTKKIWRPEDPRKSKETNFFA